jgi:hypothetical protein
VRKRKVLISSEPELKVSEPVEVREILNWVSSSSYWTAMDNTTFLKKRTLQQLMIPPATYEVGLFIAGEDPQEEINTVVGTGKTLETLRLKLLDKDVASGFIKAIQEDGLAPNSTITIVIQYQPGFEGLGSLFDPVDTPPEPMSQRYPESSDATWYRHSCWDSQLFSKSEVWITGFLRTEAETTDTEDVLSK